ncbi:dynein regulatory complex protein 8 isoform X3 [Dunckerocampus dactyliophorus]|uniref:dynein regulatory complex protein 8 isoform X3 n=1 Tax=Dunckerocampus dactyliophorus TaxID=161453 RepID=UPI0024077232|nr:dynein regulatory complex protein 8 isoform X3 [Dunckerocampus dactyliophorus]
MAANVRSAEVDKKIRAAFEAFDYQSNQTVDVREIGTIIYSLGCFPTQADLHNFIAEVEEDQTGYIHLDRFLPAMTTVLLEHKFPPISEDVLLQAFEVLDIEKKGFLDPDDLSQYMTEEVWMLPLMTKTWICTFIQTFTKLEDSLRGPMQLLSMEV